MPSCSSKGSGPAHILLWCHLSPYTRGVNITVTIAYTCSSFPVVLPTESFLQFFYSSVLLLGGSIYPLLSHISGVGDMALLLLLLVGVLVSIVCSVCSLPRNPRSLKSHYCCCCRTSHHALPYPFCKRSRTTS